MSFCVYCKNMNWARYFECRHTNQDDNKYCLINEPQIFIDGIGISVQGICPGYGVEIVTKAR